MKRRINCWEYMKCGREPGGTRVDEFGLCPAATDKRFNGVHGGKNAGRACWIVAGSMCGGKIKGIFAEKYQDCRKCEFYKKVKEEENTKYKVSTVLRSKVKES